MSVSATPLVVTPPVVPATPLADRRGLRIKQAADYIGSSPWFVEVAVRSKKIPAHKLGRHYVIFKDDLDDYVTRLRNGGGVNDLETVAHGI